MYTEKEKVISSNICEIMQGAYIDYSMSVIVSRALPDARDGLKPVQRRILYAMLREGLLHNRPFDKCAGVVGEVLKNYHPHGDSSVYDTLVRLAQPWVLHHPLIDPQGNFGSIDGDSAAAYRYTECRLKAIAEEMLKNLDENTVDFGPNYKESTTEPLVLPAAFPNLLVNGSTGIAVGMTTNIPPHNLGEIIDTACEIIDNPNISLDDISQIIQGPDFPTGGYIVGKKGIASYLKNGRGIVRVRGKAHTEDLKNGKEQIVLTEIPYNVNRASLVERIAELVQDKILTEVSDLRDESTETTRIVIELKRGEVPRVVLNKLYKHTPFESSFGVILLALDKQRPKQMNIKEMLECFIEHRREVIYRRTAFQLAKAEERAHILEGYRIALDNLDDIVRIIRKSSNREEARIELMKIYPLTETQTNAILDLRLYQLTGLEREKIDLEFQDLAERIAYYRSILENESKLLGIVKSELKEIREKYTLPRRTEIIPDETEFRLEDVIANVGCIITVTHNGFIKRTEVSSYKSQKRGGKGVIGTGQHDEDFVEHLFTASTHDYVMFVMTNGRVYVEKVYEIPEGTRISKGRSLVNVLEMPQEEKLASMLCFKEFAEGIHIVMATEKGITKKTNIMAYVNYRKGGIIGIQIDDGDRVIDARLTNGQNEIILITQNGMSIRFNEDDLRDQGRVTRGVIGIRLKESDCVKAMTVVYPDRTLLIAGKNGQGKRSSFDDYKLQKRAGSGLIAIKTPGVAGALGVHDNEEVMLLTKSGQAVRFPVKDVRIIGRTTQGVRLINLSKNDQLIGICRVIKTDEEAVDVIEEAEGS
ncbi:MAG: DNA gyrase subunit A [Verrucomicrobia bacterium GWF2_51_19]|nr:MAG: DNA gyrase subunit A [Verrucomicrobia bacterium GWF2_51_19]HCJ11973.1 DNA gyrase subunit A [Opitutae bacterium]